MNLAEAALWCESEDTNEIYLEIHQEIHRAIH